MRRFAILIAAACATPATAQGMGGMTMPGMVMPAAKKPAARPAARKPKPAAPAAHDMAAMPGMDVPAPAASTPAPPIDPACLPEHAAMGHCTPKVVPLKVVPADGAALGTALPAGNAAPPPAPADRAADRFYPPAEMALVSRMMRREHGGMAFSQIMFNLAEYQLRNGHDGYRWDGEGWFGGDINRLVIKTEGEGRGHGGIDDAEVQALYSRAIDPYFNLQGGIRQDLGAGAKRSYATIGIEGLAPYWFEVAAALFLSSRGDLLGRLEAYYDQRLTQRLLLQPRAEVNFAAQDVAASRIGAGLSNAELGLRLRYEVSRQFAPYVGLSWDRKAGDTARFARADGEGASARSIALGVRTWF